MSFLRSSHLSNTKQHNMMKNTMIDKIVSGGQSGVDRAALDVSIKLGIPHGGWCPKGRKAEDGAIPACYQLNETDSDEYSERTKLNIRDTDGTLILVPTTPIKVTDGTILTIAEVKERAKPYLIIDLSRDYDKLSEIALWVKENSIKVLNVAGPRESQSPGVHKASSVLLTSFFEATPKKENDVNLKMM